MPYPDQPPAGLPDARSPLAYPVPSTNPGPGSGPGSAPGSVSAATAAGERNWVLICYIVHVTGPLTAMLLSILGVIMNHVLYGQSRTILARSHHRWMLRTFWFFVLWLAVALVVFLVGLGGLLKMSGSTGLLVSSNMAVGGTMALAMIVWWWYRTILGLVRFSRNQPMYVPGASLPWR